MMNVMKANTCNKESGVLSDRMDNESGEKKNPQKWVVEANIETIVQLQIHKTWLSSSSFVALYTLIQRTRSSWSRENRGSGGALMLPQHVRGPA